MAHNLADELLQIILSDSLTIPSEEFRRPSTRAFARLDPQFASSSSVLLVCKRWLRVATPLLYEVVIIRSVGQAQALADAFIQNPTFALHVKKMRIEGAWDSLGAVLKCCTNIQVIFLALHIWSNDSVGGLCRGLARINPAEVILCDEERLHNAKLKKVIRALCDCIPKWSNLTEFYFPVMSGKPLVQAERNLLGEAISKSTTIRVVSADMPACWSPIWTRLASNQNLTFNFYSWIWPECSIFEESVPKNLRSRVSVMDHQTLRRRLEQRAQSKQTAPPSSFRALASVPAELWRTIFEFATLPSSAYEDTSNFGRGRVISTRISLSLVCKLFERTVRPIFFHTPLFINQNAFTAFAARVLDNSQLGPKVNTLPFNFFIEHVMPADRTLRVLLPQLTNLRHFSGEGRISFSAFQLLAHSAGEQLLSLQKLGVEEAQAVGFASPAIWNAFKQLRVLEIALLPVFELDKDVIEPDCLTHVHTLTLTSYVQNTFDLLCLMPHVSLDIFVTVRLEYVSPGPATGKFLKACGANVTELFLFGGDRAEDFNYCPNLVTLRWRPSMEITSQLLDGFQSHSKLEKMVIHKNLTEKTEEIGDFFYTLDLSGFPRLVELCWPYYRWPKEERDITRSRMVKWSMQIKERFGVVLTGEYGKAWRPRVQRRR